MQSKIRLWSSLAVLGGGLAVAVGLHAMPVTAYIGELNLSKGAIAPAGTVYGSLKVLRRTSSASAAALTFTLPRGFMVSGWTSTFYSDGKPVTSGASRCAPSGSADTGVITVPSFQLPKAGDYCLYRFKLQAPQLALLSRYSPSFALTFSGSSLKLTRDSLQVNANLPEVRPPVELGKSPGPGTWWEDLVSSKGLSRMEVTMTPHTDPGPMSYVFWANQIDIGGYFGMQSTYLRDESGKLGRLFIFSIWSGKAFKKGSSGSWCIKGDEDGPFRGCRYVHDWKPGYSYVFSLTAEGDGWFKLSVLEKETKKSFVVGSLQVDAKLNPAQAGETIRPVGFATWVEYIQWNDPRTNCESVARTEMTVSATAKDAASGKVLKYQQAPWTRPKSGVCLDVTDQRVDQSKDLHTVFLTGAPESSAFGNLKGSSGCLQAEFPFEDSRPDQANAAVFKSCVSKSKFDAGAVAEHQWVLADDGTVRMLSDYCLTARDPLGAVGSSVIVASCIKGAANQRWKRTNLQLASGVSGACLAARSSTYSATNQPSASLVNCSNKQAATWSSLPGVSTNFDD
ncbi:MAG: RICIN domain-containing protein [Comamonadaceae bacterium]|nr:RICIN domain-containing protein [Comamonadaceae bacterium]